MYNKRVFFYSSEESEYVPLLLNSDEIVSVKVTNKAETSINHSKSKIEVKDDYSLEVQYQKEHEIVRTIVIPYAENRIKETIGRL